MPLTSGTRLGPYEIQSSVGAGGMGEVYRARDTRLNRTVAIKILPPAVSSDPDRLLRFQHEALILSPQVPWNLGKNRISVTDCFAQFIPCFGCSSLIR